MSDPQNTRGTPGENEEADTASGGAPERADESKDAHTTEGAAFDRTTSEHTTDEDGTPVENPSGG
ncbi:hypothetical protein [Microbacterium tumbae]